MIGELKQRKSNGNSNRPRGLSSYENKVTGRTPPGFGSFEAVRKLGITLSILGMLFFIGNYVI